MGTHRDHLHEVSGAQLQDLTGKSYKTIRSKLRDAGLTPVRKDGRTQWWNPQTALPVILGRGVSALDAERTRESKERADKLSLENAEKRGKVIPVETAVWAVGQRLSALRSRFRGIPTAARTRLGISRDLSQSLLEMIDEALNDLASNDAPEGIFDILERDWGDAFTTVESDGERVGG